MGLSKNYVPNLVITNKERDGRLRGELRKLFQSLHRISSSKHPISCDLCRKSWSEIRRENNFSCGVAVAYDIPSHKALASNVRAMQWPSTIPSRLLSYSIPSDAHTATSWSNQRLLIRTVEHSCTSQPTSGRILRRITRKSFSASPGNHQQVKDARYVLEKHNLKIPSERHWQTSRIIVRFTRRSHIFIGICWCHQFSVPHSQ